MVMGPTHAMSGAAGWLAGAGAGLTITGITLSEPFPLVLGTLITAGAALGPDIDSHSSTVVNSFGVFGRVAHSLVNAISVGVYTMTKTKYDPERTNGHRTLFHTTFMAILMGMLVSVGASLPMSSGFVLFEKDLLWGQIFAILTFFIFFHLSLAGLFEKYFKKNKRKYGAYGMMLFSLGITLLIVYLFPEGKNYAWLGLAVGGGWFIHLIGDMITKMGVPMAWPIKIRGHRWWDVTLPALFRIRADGYFEKIILLPALTIATIVLAFVAADNLTGNTVSNGVKDTVSDIESTAPVPTAEETPAVVRPIEEG